MLHKSNAPCLLNMTYLIQVRFKSIIAPRAKQYIGAPTHTTTNKNVNGR
jgi:hypothetical protein